MGLSMLKKFTPLRENCEISRRSFACCLDISQQEKRPHTCRLLQGLSKASLRLPEKKSTLPIQVLTMFQS
jgi:hypothetical protein